LPWNHCIVACYEMLTKRCSGSVYISEKCQWTIFKQFRLSYLVKKEWETQAVNMRICGQIRLWSNHPKIIPILNMDIPEINDYRESEYKNEVDNLERSIGYWPFEHALNQNGFDYRKLIEVSRWSKYIITEYLRYWDIWNIKPYCAEILGSKRRGILEDVFLRPVKIQDLLDIIKIGPLRSYCSFIKNTLLSRTFWL